MRYDPEMYGMINRAVEGLLVREHGEATWAAVKARAGLDIDHFARVAYYDDTVTYGLVGAASEVLGQSADAILRAVGRYWVRYVAEEGYGGMLALAGDDLRTFLGHLDRMHAQIQLGHPQLRPPSFRVSEAGAAVVLHYHSEREGLGAMVVGLVEGLAERFDESVEVDWLRADLEHDHDRFRIRWT